MDPQLASMAAQFGVAGLIGWMWLTERRAGAERDKQLSDAQLMLTQGQKSIDVLLRALDDNTRAIAAMEGTQRALVDSIRGAGVPGRAAT